MTYLQSVLKENEECVPGTYYDPDIVQCLMKLTGYSEAVKDDADQEALENIEDNLHTSILRLKEAAWNGDQSLQFLYNVLATIADFNEN